MRLPICFAILFVFLFAPGLLLAASPDGTAVYKQQCAVCHENSSVTHAPSRAALRLMAPESIVRALESGLMRHQGAGLSAAQKRAVAEFLTGKAIGAAGATPAVGMCADPHAPFSLAGPGWNGWGSDLSNTRFQPADRADLTADQVPKLKLKWAFAFPDTFVANGQATLAGGRIFAASANRKVYSLDAKSGCEYWSFDTDAPARTAITIAALKSGNTSYFTFLGDRRGNVYALDAANGKLLWKVHVDDNPSASIGGAPAYYEGRLYVPLTALEEGMPLDPKYTCCTGRGAMLALDALTGNQVWKTYTVAEKPHLVRTTKDGKAWWGPSGASIWSAPTLDLERQIIYTGTGNNFSEPSTNTSDAILAFDMKTGKMLWSRQITEKDAYDSSCHLASRENCPESDGPDFDIGASPILVKLADGKRILLVSQKSGVAHGIDPDNEGKILWEQRVGHGGTLGGIQWGSASDGKNMYVANSDMTWTKEEKSFGRRPNGKGMEERVLDRKIGGGLFALDAATGARVWAAPPAPCRDQPVCSPAQSAAVTAIPGVVFSGSTDGHLRAYSARDGKVIWDFDTAREYKTVNGLAAKGGSVDGPGPTIVDGMLYVNSGYGIRGGMPGNVLLAFSVEEK